ncbi:MAG: PHP domain-containing protein [Proteobacteria bacterium]|nr:PHP domain-containing protein [Pseudomonadota bacterium]
MPRKIIADLHNHSTASDGEFAPADIVKKAKTLGLKGFGLTDHDTLSGLEEAIQAGNKLDISVLPGVEISLRFQRPYFVGSLHILLYFKPQLLENSYFISQIEDVMTKGRGDELVKIRVQSINQEFGPEGKQPILKKRLSFEEIAACASNISRRHFALVLKENHHIEDPKIVQQMIGNNSPAYVPSGIDMSLLKPVLATFPVLGVFAHPAAGEFPGPSHYREVLPKLDVIERVYPEFIELGIEGLEVYYPGHTARHRDMLLEWAERDDLVVTGGSDCHDEKNRPLGVDGVTKPEWDILFEKLMAKE